MKLLILGKPGSGKGIQSDKICEKYKTTHISTGDIFREILKKQSPLSKKIKNIINSGKLVSDEITNEIVKNRLSQADCKNRFLLDGFPRNLFQAEFLSQIEDINAVVYLKVNDKEIIKRISSRRVCPNCKAVYNIITMPPKIEGICDNCKTPLIQREDDRPESIKERLDTYNKQTKPLIKYYSKKGLLKEINGEQVVEKVFEDITKLLDKLE